MAIRRRAVSKAVLRSPPAGSRITTAPARAAARASRGVGVVT
jgi:hypothetical protein